MEGCCECGDGSSGFTESGQILDLILSTEQDMITDRSVIDAQFVVVDDGLLLAIQSAFGQCLMLAVCTVVVQSVR